jgi:hypothetical protein
MLRLVAAASLAALLAGCGQQETINFSANVNQSAIVRDGRPALVSRKKQSIVLVGPAGREIAQGVRPVYIVAATNLTGQPLDLRVANIQVNQRTPGGSLRPLQVITYEQLVQEERTRQVIGALLVGAAAGANAYSASRSGYGTYSGTVYTPRGAASYSGTYFSPTANAIAQANASAQNEAMISSTIARGQANMASLERSVLKDNSIMPGEWIGGQLHFAPPESEGGQSKQYTISISIGGEVHEIDVTQGPRQSS